MVFSWATLRQAGPAASFAACFCQRLSVWQVLGLRLSSTPELRNEVMPPFSTQWLHTYSVRGKRGEKVCCSCFFLFLTRVKSVMPNQWWVYHSLKHHSMFLRTVLEQDTKVLAKCSNCCHTVCEHSRPKDYLMTCMNVQPPEQHTKNRQWWRE